MKPLRVLMVEDSEDDALLVALELRRGGWAPDLVRVETPEALRAALDQGPWDVVISDWSLPSMNGLDALRILRDAGARELPLVLVSGTIGEETAVEALKQGAGDLVMKQNLGRLACAVERELAASQVRRERSEAFQALEQAVAARDAFLSIASHELKTPLTALQLQLESLVRAVQAGGAGTERVSERVRNVSRSTERLGELVHRLLDVSRTTSAGRLELQKEELDLAELVREVAARFEGALADAGSELHLELPGRVAGTWDRARIDTIVTNLLSNAVKYGDGRPIEVALRGDGGLAVLEVRDRGIGIPPGDEARIFERFERAVREHHYGGFGVGLWVARCAAEEHGGRLGVASRPGGGSTFVLELPRGGGTPA